MEAPVSTRSGLLVLAIAAIVGSCLAFSAGPASAQGKKPAGKSAAKPHEPAEVFQRVLDYLRTLEKEEAELFARVKREMVGQVYRGEKFPEEVIRGYPSSRARDGIIQERIQMMTHDLAETRKLPVPNLEWAVMKRWAYLTVVEGIDWLWSLYLREADARVGMLNAEVSEQYEAMTKLYHEKNPEFRDPRNGEETQRVYCAQNAQARRALVEKIAPRYPRIAERLAAVRKRLVADIKQWDEFSQGDDYPGEILPGQPGPRSGFGSYYSFATLLEDFSPSILGDQRPWSNYVVTFHWGMGGCGAAHSAEDEAFFPRRYSPFAGFDGDHLCLRMGALFEDDRLEETSAEIRRPKLYLYAQTVSRLQSIDRLYVGVPTVVEAQFEPPYDQPECEIEVSTSKGKLKLTAKRVDKEGYVFRTEPFLPEGAFPRESQFSEVPVRRTPKEP